jgi:hypothetical protein
MSVYAPKKPSAINSFSVTLTVLVSLALFFGSFYLPHAYRAWVLSGVIVSIGNDAYREFDDEKIMKKLVTEANRRGLPLKRDNFVVQRNHYLPAEIPSETAAELFRKRGKSITIVVGYEVDAEWPLIDKRTKLRFQKQRDVDLKPIDYTKNAPKSCDNLF